MLELEELDVAEQAELDEVVSIARAETPTEFVNCARVSKAQTLWYVQRMAVKVIVEPYQRELLALASGFSSTLPRSWVQNMLSPRELAELLCGPELVVLPGVSRPDFQFASVFRVELDEELMQERNMPLRRALWTVLDK
eukprot:SAG31_NODE_27227_length_429_cov_1.081818_1_plen_138_part_10